LEHTKDYILCSYIKECSRVALELLYQRIDKTFKSLVSEVSVVPWKHGPTNITYLSKESEEIYKIKGKSSMIRTKYMIHSDEKTRALAKYFGSGRTAVKNYLNFLAKDRKRYNMMKRFLATFQLYNSVKSELAARRSHDWDAPVEIPILMISSYLKGNKGENTSSKPLGKKKKNNKKSTKIDVSEKKEEVQASHQEIKGDDVKADPNDFYVVTERVRPEDSKRHVIDIPADNNWHPLLREQVHAYNETLNVSALSAQNTLDQIVEFRSNIKLTGLVFDVAKCPLIWVPTRKCLINAPRFCTASPLVNDVRVLPGVPDMKRVRTLFAYYVEHYIALGQTVELKKFYERYVVFHHPSITYKTSVESDALFFISYTDVPRHKIKMQAWR